VTVRGRRPSPVWEEATPAALVAGSHLSFGHRSRCEPMTRGAGESADGAVRIFLISRPPTGGDRHKETRWRLF